MVEKKSPDGLLSFERPPVTEVVLGVQFDLLPKFRNAHLGAFWKSLGPEWAKVADATPIEPQFERFGEAALWGRAILQLKVVQEPSSRLQIRDGADRMIQVQNGRFHYNWTKPAEGRYPRYAELRPAFDEALAGFTRFVAAEDLGIFQPNQWEVTYVNHIPKGPLWNDLAEARNIFRAVGPAEAVTAAVQLENFSSEWHYEIVPCRGRLHVQLQHARLLPPNNSEILAFTLTARGAIEDGAVPSLSEGLDLGHETIVRAFGNLTSDSAHTYWGVSGGD